MLINSESAQEFLFYKAALMPNGGVLLSVFMSLFYCLWKLFALYILERKCNVSIIKSIVISSVELPCWSSVGVFRIVCIAEECNGVVGAALREHKVWGVISLRCIPVDTQRLTDLHPAWHEGTCHRWRN